LVGGVLELTMALDASALQAVADLERRVGAADGGRLKLEWGHLRSRPGDRVEDLLWWDGDRLVGFLGLYAFSAPAVELTGMVDPDARRQGIATALLDAALPLCRERGYAPVLLVTPRIPVAARELARSRGAVLHHSEHALQQIGSPTEAPADPRLTLRPMTRDDAEAVSVLDALGFGGDGDGGGDGTGAEAVARALRRREETVLGDLDGAMVAVVRVSREGDAARVYGFAVHPDHQGHGIGRDVLRRICLQARADGAARVELEVAVDNDRALGLYTSLGFTAVATDDYYALPG
jgi:ribosomal protein S18 acetylase RimI-like enzyme